MCSYSKSEGGQAYTILLTSIRQRTQPAGDYGNHSTYKMTAETYA